MVGAKREDLKVEAGDELDFITWGGGGWGDPLARDPALVATEVEQALVTAAGARAYGVILRDDGTVDEPASTTLREAVRSLRPDALPLFNYGPSVENLRTTALADTGLDAPRPPPAARALLAAE